MSREDKQRFFIRVANTEWQEVTEEDFRSVERSCGFHRPTASFGSGTIQGTTVYADRFDKRDWTPGVKELPKETPTNV